MGHDFTIHTQVLTNMPVRSESLIHPRPQRSACEPRSNMKSKAAQPQDDLYNCGCSANSFYRLGGNQLPNLDRRQRKPCIGEYGRPPGDIGFPFVMSSKHTQPTKHHSQKEGEYPHEN